MYPSLSCVVKDDLDLQIFQPLPPECRDSSLLSSGTQSLVHISQACFQLSSIHSPWGNIFRLLQVTRACHRV